MAGDCGGVLDRMGEGGWMDGEEGFDGGIREGGCPVLGPLVFILTFCDTPCSNQRTN